MRLLRRIMICAVLIILAASLGAETDEELRQLWMRRDLARMEEIARTGDARAEAWMGLMLQNRGRRVEAKEWWRRAAEKGNRWAINSLAFMHLGDREDEQAAYWYRRGAEAGDRESQHTYAWLLLQGRGVAKDEGEAARWYAAAAAQGQGDAYFDLAKLYADGVGVVRDPVEAYALASLAEVTGDPSETYRATELKAQLGRSLSSDQISAASGRAIARRPDLKGQLGQKELEDRLGIFLPVLLGIVVLTPLLALFYALRWASRGLGWALARLRG
jgi:TPR repeat protein